MEEFSSSDDARTCGICMETAIDSRSLPCLHSFCVNCIDGYCISDKTDGELDCPVCGNTFTVPLGGAAQLPHHVGPSSETAAACMGSPGSVANTEPERPQCEVCGTGSDSAELIEEGCKSVVLATFLCVDCDQKLCERCSKPHKKMKHRPHNVIRLSDIPAKAASCDKHEGNSLNIYCDDCQVDACSLCIESEHSSHKSHRMEELKAQLLQQIDSVINPRISEINKETERLGCEKAKLLEDTARTEKYVKERGDELKQLIDNHIDSLLHQLHSFKTVSIKEIESSRERLQVGLMATWSLSKHYRCTGYAGYGSDDSSCKPSDFVQSAASLHDTVSELLQPYVLAKKVSIPKLLLRTPKNLDQLGNVVGSLERVTLGEDPNNQLAARFSLGFTFQSPTVKEQQQDDVESLKQKVKGLQDKLKSAKAAETKIISDDSKRLYKQVNQVYHLQMQMKEVELWEPCLMKHLTSQARVVRTMSSVCKDGDIRGLACIGQELFVVSSTSSNVDVYDTATGICNRSIQVNASRSQNVDDTSGVYGGSAFGLPSVVSTVNQTKHVGLRDLLFLQNNSVAGNDFFDMASSAHDRSLYISDPKNKSIFKIYLGMALTTIYTSVTRWSTNLKPFGLSVTSTNNVLVAFTEDCMLKEYSSSGVPGREIKLREGIMNALQAVQVSLDHFVVCHDLCGDPLKHISLIASDGEIARRFGSEGMQDPIKGSCYMATDPDGFIFVADYRSSRVMMLSPRLHRSRIAVSRLNLLHHDVRRLCYDSAKKQMYVTDGHDVTIVEFVKLVSGSATESETPSTSPFSGFKLSVPLVSTSFSLSQIPTTTVAPSSFLFGTAQSHTAPGPK